MGEQGGSLFAAYRSRPVDRLGRKYLHRVLA
jgi:hypothetical protein